MKKIIVLGGGGHARVLIEMLLLLKMDVIGFTDKNQSQEISGVPYIGQDDVILSYQPTEIFLINGIGSVGDQLKRKQLFLYFKSRGYSFASVVHPSAVISSSAILGEGIQVMAGAVLQTGVRIGDNCIINTRASIDHDSQIGCHVHIAPGATLSGGVQVAAEAHIGAGSVVIQNIRIGTKCIVGAGAVVVKNIPDLVRVAGVPARPI
ncbi:acetyltransferase [Brevibacillus borstelensis]|uniref:acetyltransferase n=1 Tax=Brevibacillus borstelensis TaxID=45462 RepID=UPI0020426B94|nr:acetyltransferase [Brevibacillus borstelensis]MCM3590175.1 acetyltransferase [Brevibacillus borstelensis]